jgi:hypothetical protein
MKQILLLKNSRPELIVKSVNPFSKVYLVHFSHYLKDTDDLSSFEIEWSLNDKKQKVCQHFNFTLSGLPDVRSTYKPRNILKQLTSLYDVQEPFSEFLVRLGKRFHSDRQTLCVLMDIPD